MDERSPADTADAPFHGPADIVCRSAVGAVALCSCGHLHVNLRYITLRFEPDAFRELQRMLAHAQRRLDADACLASPPEAGPAPMH